MTLQYEPLVYLGVKHSKLVLEKKYQQHGGNRTTRITFIVANRELCPDNEEFQKDLKNAVFTIHDPWFDNLANDEGNAYRFGLKLWKTVKAKVERAVIAWENNQNEKAQKYSKRAFDLTAFASQLIAVKYEDFGL